MYVCICVCVCLDVQAALNLNIRVSGVYQVMRVSQTALNALNSTETGYEPILICQVQLYT